MLKINFVDLHTILILKLTVRPHPQPLLHRRRGKSPSPPELPLGHILFILFTTILTTWVHWAHTTSLVTYADANAKGMHSQAT